MFQPNIYKLFNNDLKHLNNNKLFFHWKTIGKKENRISNITDFFKKYPNFKLNIYKYKFPQLQNLDDLIIMSHYHHNRLQNNENDDLFNSSNNENSTNLENKNIDNFNKDELLIYYLHNYYNYNHELSIIFIDCLNIFDFNYNSIKYFDNFPLVILSDKNYNDKYNFNDSKPKHIHFYKCLNNIYHIQDILLNLKYHYFLFPKNIDFLNKFNFLNKNSNIIIHDNYIIINKKLLYNYNFYDILNLYFNFKHINNIIYYKNEQIHFNQFKFYNLSKYLYIDNISKNNEKDYKIKIFIDIDYNNISELFLLFQQISYLENNNLQIILKEFNYQYFYHYFNTSYIINPKKINSINEIDFDNSQSEKEKIYSIDKNFILPSTNKFDNIKKINTSLYNNFFQSLLFLDLKKDIIIIYVDKNITELYIIQCLINLDFQNSIIILFNEFNIQMELFNHITFINIFEIIENNVEKINKEDIELFIGLFSDYYIGPNNDLVKIWNLLNTNLLSYINNYDHSFMNVENIIFCQFNTASHNNVTNTYLMNSIIQYNYKLYIFIENKIIELDESYISNYNYILYYFNDYIFHYFFNKYNIISSKNKKDLLLNLNLKNSESNNNNNSIDLNECKTISIIKNNNNIYLKYFNNFKKIENDLYKNLYLESIDEDTINTNNISFNFKFKYILIFIISDKKLILYYQKIFDKYLNNINYILQFYCFDKLNDEDEKNIKNNKNIFIEHIDIDIEADKNNSNYFNYIFTHILHEYSKYDIIIIFKNLIQLQHLSYHIMNDIFLFNMYNNQNINKSYIINHANYIFFPLFILTNDSKYNILQNYFKLTINTQDEIKNSMLSLKNYIDSCYINQNVKFKNILNIQDINELPIISNKCFQIKFLLYTVNNEYYGNNNAYLQEFILKNDDNIKYFFYHFHDKILLILLNNLTNIKIKIDMKNLNNIFHKCTTNHKIIYYFLKNDINFNINFSKNNHEIIYNEKYELAFINLFIQDLKLIGYFNEYYFEDTFLSNLNIQIIKSIINVTFYLLHKNDTKKIDYENIQKFLPNQKYLKKFESIQLSQIIPIRFYLNTNFTFQYIQFLNIIIINLPNRVDKRKYMIDQMNYHNINNYIFFDGIKINKNELQQYSFIKSETFLNYLNIDYVLGSSGCKLSHHKIIQTICKNQQNIENKNKNENMLTLHPNIDNTKYDNYNNSKILYNELSKYTLILEDDVVLEHNFLFYLIHVLKQIHIHNIDIDILYLGCNLNDEKNNSLILPNLLKVSNPKTTTAYLINNKKSELILNTIENSTNEIDNTYAESSLNKYCIFPMIAYQKDLKSDITLNNYYGYYHDKYYYKYE